MARQFIRLLGSAFLIAVVPQSPAQGIPAFPGAQGFGAYATGGRGGDVYIVTNLNDSGAGSFAQGIASVPPGGRTIVFAVSGYIRIPNGSGGLRMTASKVTIAGQTAPGDGIGFFNNNFRISGDDVILRHLRFRRGKTESSGDCLNLDSGTTRAMLDHLSVQFSTDENISSFSNPPDYLTFQWSLNAWGLESHSCGGLWDQQRASTHHTLWAHNHTRNPKARPGILLEWVNNITYDWDIGFIMGDSQTPAAWKANLRNNYFVCPPGNIRARALEKANLDRNGNPNFTIHMSGNWYDGNGNGILDGVAADYTLASGNYLTSVDPMANTGSLAIEMDSARLAYKKIVSDAGALRPDARYQGLLRDEVDTILFSKLAAQQRAHVSHPDQTGASNGGLGTLAAATAPVDTDRDGMPDFYETALGWNPAVQDHNTALASSGGLVSGTTYMPAGTVAGYTRLEEYLHYKSIPHATVDRNTGGTPATLVVDLSRYTSGFVSSPAFTVSNVTGGSVALSGAGNTVATFTPALNASGRARFDFTVTDASGDSWTRTFAIVLLNNSLPRDLRWRGNAAAWDTSSAHWTVAPGGTPAVFSTGDRVFFSEAGSSAPSITLTGPVSPGSMDVDSTTNYTVTGAGAIQAVGQLAKRGSGTLVLANTGTSSFSAILLEAGTLALQQANAGGSGNLNFAGGALSLSPPSNTNIPLAPVFSVPATITVGSQHAITGNWIGDQTVTVHAPSNHLWTIAGNWNSFTGKLAAGSGTPRFRLNGNSNVNFGNAAASVDLGAGAAELMNRNGATISIGELVSTGSNTRLSGSQTGTAASTYRIGGRDSDATFAGSIRDGGGTTSIVKEGSGEWTLTGASTHTGTTTISAGTLRVNGSLGATTLTTTANAALGGAGTLGGPVSLATGATVDPGSAPGGHGTLSCPGGFSATGAVFEIDLSSDPAGTNDRVRVSGGTGFLGGTNAFNVNFSEGTIGAGNYKLIDCDPSVPLNVGSGMVMNLSTTFPSGGRQTFSLVRTASGTNGGFVQLVVSGSPATLTWTGAANGSWDTTSANWTGGAPALFFPYDAVVFNDSAITTSIVPSAPVLPRATTFQNTTAKSFTLAAGLDGGSLSKGNSGTLNLTGDNLYPGGTVLAGGILQLANDTANSGGLGSGLVSFQGGTLRMYDNSSSYTDVTWNMDVPSGQSGTLWQDSRSRIFGSLAGGGTLNLRVPWVRCDWLADSSAFSGVLNVTTDGDGGDLRFGTSYAWSGWPQAAVHLNGAVSAYYLGISNAGAGTSIPIGELSGTANARLLGGVTSGRNFTYIIGSRTPSGGEAVFAGTIAEQNPGVTTSFVKRGLGIWTLSGNCQWNGGTSIEEGVLRITGNVTSAGAMTIASGASLALDGGTLSSDAIHVDAGAVFQAQGSINGDVNVQGTLVGHGDPLNLSGNLVNEGTIRLTGNAALSVNGSFINNGVLDLLTGGDPPAGLVNNGIVISNDQRRILEFQRVGNSFTCTVAGFVGHSYRLQRALSLDGPWMNIGPAVAGNGSEISFVDPAAPLLRAFYRVSVSP